MLESCQWNVSAAAARLHISRRTIYRKIHRHGLRPFRIRSLDRGRELCNVACAQAKWSPPQALNRLLVFCPVNEALIGKPAQKLREWQGDFESVRLNIFK